MKKIRLNAVSQEVQENWLAGIQVNSSYRQWRGNTYFSIIKGDLIRKFNNGNTDHNCNWLASKKKDLYMRFR
jgi:hypothetical protein